MLTQYVNGLTIAIFTSKTGCLNGSIAILWEIVKNDLRASLVR